MKRIGFFAFLIIIFSCQKALQPDKSQATFTDKIAFSSTVENIPPANDGKLESRACYCDESAFWVQVTSVNGNTAFKFHFIGVFGPSSLITIDYLSDIGPYANTCYNMWGEKLYTHSYCQEVVTAPWVLYSGFNNAIPCEDDTVEYCCSLYTYATYDATERTLCATYCGTVNSWRERGRGSCPCY